MENAPTFNFISTLWLPVVRASGQRQHIRPADLTTAIDSDPIVDLDFPRADFRCATLEFLIGLLTVACPPGDDWETRWTKPPSQAELELALAPLATAFAFDGDGARAYQDLEDFATKPTRVEALLIEAPGVNAVEKNTALLVKAGRVETLSRSAAAVAILTLQTMAPAGGRGYLTSLRGGGPLTTLIVPKRRTTLWHLLWANMPPGEEPPKPCEFPRIFPWLIPTRVSSEAGRTTTPTDVDWRQAFFGMPRRIRLDFQVNVGRLPCDLTGEIDTTIVRTYRALQYGTKYDAWGGVHPLTPHYRAKPNDPVLSPEHGQNERMGYRQWLAMLYGTKEGRRVPAACVSYFLSHRKDDLPKHERTFRLSAAGYDMDNMKARAFIEAETPDIMAPEGDGQAVADRAKDFVAAAEEVAVTLRLATKTALYGQDAKVDTDTTPLTTARDRFWADTHDGFFAFLNDFSSRPSELLAGDDAQTQARNWLDAMEKAALAIFDDTAPMLDARSLHVERVVKGRSFLVSTLRGYGKRGLELFKNLQLPTPEAPPTRKGKAA
jgi:CRISPR system Cascade subunit CasA